ncbi:MAG: hypothetical protein ACI8PQ_002183 [Planctomycetota bacterium]|jgi:hypothetical protein
MELRGRPYLDRGQGDPTGQPPALPMGDLRADFVLKIQGPFLWPIRRGILQA